MVQCIRVRARVVIMVVVHYGKEVLLEVLFTGLIVHLRPQGSQLAVVVRHMGHLICLQSVAIASHLRLLQEARFANRLVRQVAAGAFLRHAAVVHEVVVGERWS